jgi:hypothetical protein
MKREQRRSVVAEESVGQQGKDHDIQEDDHEQSDLNFPVMLGQSGVNRLELPVLGELVTFLGFHGSPSATDTAAFTRAPKAAQFRISHSTECTYCYFA